MFTFLIRQFKFKNCVLNSLEKQNEKTVTEETVNNYV